MSSSLYFLYLSRAARENLPTGLDAGKWGLTEDAVERHLELLSQPSSGLEVLRRLEIGDEVLAASGGPQPRVKRGGWDGAVITEGFLLRITAPYHHETTAVWPAPARRPGELYPHRFGIELLEELEDFGADRVGLRGMDALHYSANIGGLPVPVVPESPLLWTLGPPQEGETEDPGMLALAGDLDGISLTTIRREQRKLRAKVLGRRTKADCSLCGRTVPVDCLRVAHIKKRCECSEAERLDLANIMLACTIGCDHLFELGYIYLNQRGVLRRNTKRAVTAAIDETIGGLEGSIREVYSEGSAPYFRWHRAEVAS
jgi:hypothetical protein